MVRGQSSIGEEGRTGDAGRGPVGQWDRDSQTEERSRRAEVWPGGTAGWPLKGHFQGMMQVGSWAPHPACGAGEAGIRGKTANGGQAGPTAMGSWQPSSSLPGEPTACKRNKGEGTFQNSSCMYSRPPASPAILPGLEVGAPGGRVLPHFPSPDSIPGSL